MSESAMFGIAKENAFNEWFNIFKNDIIRTTSFTENFTDINYSTFVEWCRKNNRMFCCKYDFKGYLSWVMRKAGIQIE